jgi:hypothetical protein
MQIAALGIDLGKNSCSVVGLDVGGAVVLRRRMRWNPPLRGSLHYSNPSLVAVSHTVLCRLAFFRYAQAIGCNISSP